MKKLKGDDSHLRAVEHAARAVVGANGVEELAKRLRELRDVVTAADDDWECLDCRRMCPAGDGWCRHCDPERFTRASKKTRRVRLYIIRMGAFVKQGLYVTDCEPVVRASSLQSEAFRTSDRELAEGMADLIGDARVVALRRA